MGQAPKDAAGLRDVQELVHEGQPARAIIAGRLYSTERRKLWQALTDPSRVAEWFFPVSGDLRPGGNYSLEGHASGSILACSQLESFRVSWEFPGSISWVAVEFEQKDQALLLRLTHTMPRDEPGESHWQQFGAGATGIGWDLGFMRLSRTLGLSRRSFDGKPVLEWLGTGAGKDFVRSSADAWCRAHIHSGELDRTARDMADRAYRFYTGG